MQIKTNTDIIKHRKLQIEEEQTKEENIKLPICPTSYLIMISMLLMTVPQIFVVCRYLLKARIVIHSVDIINVKVFCQIIAICKYHLALK